MMKADVLIIDDSIIFTQGLELLLSQNPKVATIHTAQNYQEAMDILLVEKVHIAIIDLNFDSANFDGFTIAEKLRQQYPGIKIMILTQHAQIDHYETLINVHKVDAYLDKQLGIKETFTAISKILNGEQYIDPNISEMVAIGRWLKISDREREVINELTSGFTQKEIAEKLFINARTVETHIRNLCKKFDVKNSAELVSVYAKYKMANRENYDKTIAPFKKI